MATIRDVAVKAGVSTTTVSHVLNQSRFVSAESTRRVRRAMAELRYQPNALARSLRQSQTRTLGVIVPDSANPFFAEVIRGIEAVAYGKGYTVLFGSSEDNAEKEAAYLRIFMEKQVDGLAMFTLGQNTKYLKQLLEQRLPIVIMDREFKGVAASYVISDDLKGGFQATEHLIQLGHQRIACISGDAPTGTGAVRMHGYKQALVRHGIRYDRELVIPADFKPEGGYAAAQQLLNNPRRPTAIFTCNDLMAIGAIGAIHDMGLTVPEDISIVGFDDIELAAYTFPPLTTVRQPKYEIGSLTARVLLEGIESGNPLRADKHILTTTLVIRKSTQKKI